MPPALIAPTGPAFPEGPNPAEDEPVALLGIANAVLRRRRALVTTAAALALAVGLLSFFSGARYTSTLAFAPQGRRSMSNLAGLAAQFGLSLPSADATQVPQFYVDLLNSYSVLGAIVDAPFDVQTDTGRARGTLIALYHAEGRTPALAREEAIRELKRQLSASPSQKTGVVKVTVRSLSPELARAIGQQALEQLNKFNLASRTTLASAERAFTEQRRDESRKALRDAEESLRNFRVTNRSTTGSPVLELEADRLEREVALRQQLYTALSTAFEQARIEEVRDTPVISVVERPTLPVQRDPRGTVGKAVGAFLAVLVLGMVWLVLRDRWETSLAGRAPAPDDQAEFQALMRATLADLRRPWRFLYIRAG
jgi:uncharacterized protein involved in exopolysaccharide biosynthesis